MRRTLKAEGRGAHGEADEGERTLAAILSADVAGNSRLTGNDELNEIGLRMTACLWCHFPFPNPLGVSLF
jgi:hypothetical protein